MIGFVSFIICLALSLVNVGIWASTGSIINGLAAIWCGALAVFCLAMELRRNY